MALADASQERSRCPVSPFPTVSSQPKATVTATGGSKRLPDRAEAGEALADTSPTQRVGWGFITLYALAYLSTSLVFIAPLLVTLALKVNSLLASKRHRRASG